MRFEIRVLLMSGLVFVIKILRMEDLKFGIVRLEFPLLLLILGRMSFYNWYNDNGATCSNNYISTVARPDSSSRTTTTTTTTTIATAIGGMKPNGRIVLGSNGKISKESMNLLLTEAYDLVEPDAEDLLAKYTHNCQICGKGFKRDAYLRMHMRAHGDEYKTSEALSNPLKREEWSS